ncbi:hypothetical protein [Acanthopleuribacter pedis]|uniref:Uncharacterized protein n=1 Tax=Acanthopleuribacter pedis TaxID=442870 RepID=A0A8J7QEV6_9BACT|nr:hypothetical protein [Acanthopleuribacter pedis]MBO1322714.1 hypothetical protein [Acanthopleuribacter pedis]
MFAKTQTITRANNNSELLAQAGRWLREDHVHLLPQLARQIALRLDAGDPELVPIFNTMAADHAGKQRLRILFREISTQTANAGKRDQRRRVLRRLLDKTPIAQQTANRNLAAELLDWV